MTLAIGSIAPDFALPDEHNTLRRLSDYRGMKVLLYFYPKDDTPGCTTEACSFRDDYSAYVKKDVAILGVSPDTSASHLKFKDKYSLPFPLLADANHVVCDQYGVWGPKKFMGREFDGVLRTTYLIDPAGRVQKVFENVKPTGHSEEILASLA